ncbi:NAD-dependent protein deacylase [Neobacillus dielmonensis]|uniref:NAD-dependent protein deacylase n=1 Tax=Neobacillus dielmonensis TaxID=1347369 RepID=UPI000694C658|nr:NAD-dependent protein deacylase [Neobacillus dielmonensis]
MESTIQECAGMIRDSKNMVVLTGAGISTESGIKDFRSRTGIYQLAPEYILSLDYFYQQPRAFYQFAFENLYHPNAVPNKGHDIIAYWEKQGMVTQIITQNIDGLHQKAGSKHVIEFHGTMETAICLNCGKIYSADEMGRRMNTMEDFYVCDACEAAQKFEHYIKPNVVLFGDSGEWFTPEGFHTILNKMESADCILVLGTSLNVTPFSTFPQYKQEGVPLIIINIGQTPYDHQPDTHVIHESIGQTLTEINEAL